MANKAGLFSPGMFARVRVTGSAPYAAVLLPDEAIGTDQTNKFVYVVGEDGTVARRNVRLGPLVDGLRVVREGVGGRRLGGHEGPAARAARPEGARPSARRSRCPSRSPGGKAPE